MPKPLLPRPAGDRAVRRPWAALAGAALLAACSTPAPEARSAAAAAPTADVASASATPATMLATTPAVAPAAQGATVTVYKSPSCGCCANWVEHMQKHGYKVVVHDIEDVAPVKAQLGVPEGLASCHTATVGGYVLEGHVPAADVDRLLRERPKVVGVAVPGMVTGSPGMEMPGTPADRYDVVAFDQGGTRHVFASH